VRRKHSVTDQRFFDRDSSQVRKYLRFNPTPSAGIFSRSIGNVHFDLPPEFLPKIPANISPVFPREFSESDSQSSSGSVKKSGGQSDSFESFALPLIMTIGGWDSTAKMPDSPKAGPAAQPALPGAIGMGHSSSERYLT
jgi:hypothetical protein